MHEHGQVAYRMSTSRFTACAAVSLFIGHLTSLLVLLANFRTVLVKLGQAFPGTDVRCAALHAVDIIQSQLYLLDQPLHTRSLALFAL